MLKFVSKNALILAAAAVSCVFAVAVVNQLTKDKIAHQQQLNKLKILVEVQPELAGNTDVLNDCVAMTNLALLGKDSPQQIYRYRQNGEVKSYLIETTAPDGYSGNIEILAAIAPDLTIQGVRVLSHKETPGLGDKIELKRHPWILSFEQKTLSPADDKTFAVKKDGGQFDQFAGATITPRAVVNAVKKAALFVQATPELATLPANCGASR